MSVVSFNISNRIGQDTTGQDRTEQIPDLGDRATLVTDQLVVRDHPVVCDKNYQHCLQKVALDRIGATVTQA